MINPEVEEHPHYDITNKMREIYPNECEKWERLLREARDPKNRGCFTCQHYKPIDNAGDTGFVDVEDLDDHYVLPWDTEAAYVWCDKFPDADMSLKIGCHLWKQYKLKI